MKKTSFIRQINKENKKYKIVKTIAYLQTKLSFGKKRKQKELSYSFFQDDFHFHRSDNSIPEQYYFKPTDIIIYDLIRKEDLSKTKKGLIKLYKKCYSHKYIGGNRSEEDIERIIQGLDQTLHSVDSWYRTSIFDFAYDENMDSYIKCFAIRFLNFSSSYAAIEMRIALSDDFINEISEFIKKQYKKPGMKIHRTWGRNRKQSGAKIMYGVSPGTLSEYAKSQLVYEQIQYVKQIYLHEMANYFPMLLYTSNKNIASINVFETNITPSLQLDKSIYAALGLDEMCGFFFSLAERFYTSTVTIGRISEPESDMMFVYNAEMITDYHMYGSAHNYVLEHLTMDCMEELYRVIILSELGMDYWNLISEYRNKINECKTGRRQHKLLLKLKYQLNQDFYDFQKIDEELPVDKKLERADKVMRSNTYTKHSICYGIHTYEQFINMPRQSWMHIRSNYAEAANDLDRKLEISDSLAKYTSERNNRGMVLIQVVLAAATFFFLIFPKKAEAVAKLIKQLWDYLNSLF